MQVSSSRQEATSETPFSTPQSPARQEARVPAPDGDPRRQGSAKGPPPEGPAPSGCLTCQKLGRSAFRALRSSRTARSGPIAVSWLPAASPAKPLFAFAIGKTVGNAVVRNRLRRRMKEVLRLDESLPSGAYLVRAQPAAAALDFSTLQDNLRRATAAATRQAKRARTRST